MAAERERVLVLEGDAVSRGALVELLGGAGYEVIAAPSPREGMAAIRNLSFDLLLLDADLSELDCCEVLKAIKGSSATEAIHVVLLSSGGAAERGRGLDLGADDVVSRPWEPAELLARVRAELRAKRQLDSLREKTRLAEEGQEIAHTAFQALAVTEKMTRDAFSFGRVLRVGAVALFVVAVSGAAWLVFFSRRTERETRRAYAIIAQLERGVARQQDLVEASRKMRQETSALGSGEKDSGAIATLRKEVAETSARLTQVESQDRVAQSIIRTWAPSVCLLHVVVAFREKQTGQRLRYAGINPQGEPLQDSEGKPIFTLVGQGPQVTAHFFGTGFLAGPDGRILTNRHVVEPWWKNDDLNSVAQEGIEPVISEITAYFPDTPGSHRVEIAKISNEADLAMVQGDIDELKSPPLDLDDSKGAAISGQPVVSMGYATALAGILARAGEDTAEAVIRSTNGTPRQVLEELARRKLIRPITTQGHIGDVLPDKIVFDAQTTSGGSGGPLFNHHGKVVGVTFAAIRGFGGSNFGIPIHYARPLLAR